MSQPPLKTVLIVDDNAVIREVLRGMIGHDPRLKFLGQAATGEAAMDAIRSSQPDLVCLDVMLPGMDGLEVLREIRSSHPATRVILITSHSSSEVVENAMKAGANGFIVKPFSANKLLNTIYTALGMSAPGEEGIKRDPTPPA